MISFSSRFPCPPLQHAYPDVEMILIGNNCDLVERKEVPKEVGEQLAKSWGIPFLETSPKTGHNIDEVRGHLMMSCDFITRVLFLQAFEQLARQILRLILRKVS